MFTSSPATIMRCAIALVLGVLTVALGASVKTGGETLVSPHIVGDKPERPQDVPYVIRLRLSSRSGGEPIRYCGAVRLNTDWFVTAAECLDNKKYDLLQISYPRLDFGGAVSKHTMNIKYTAPVLHPRYNKDTKENNIGLIHCGFECEDIEDHIGLFPVLPKKGGTLSSAKPIVAGWTITDTTAGEQDVDEITSYETTMVNSFLCKIVYFFRSVSSKHICVSARGGKRITKGHTGVPLVVREGSEPNSRLKLLGIASSIQPWTTKLPLPTVFTNIADYSEWIANTAQIPILE